MATNLPRSPKPSKPHRDFPLTANGNGQWSKKIRGKVYYFGVWADPPAALAAYLDQKDDLLAGRTPRRRDALTVGDLCEQFLDLKAARVDSGELSQLSLVEYTTTCQRMLDTLGSRSVASEVRPEDFAKLRAVVAEKWGPVRLGNEIQRVRSVFKFGFDDGLLAVPMRFGQAFAKPSAGVLRRHRASRPSRVFTAIEIRRLLSHARGPLKAMILLGVNCGFGNLDVALVPRSSLDLPGGWVDFPRPKTGIKRRAALWPETVDAIREVNETRPPAHDSTHADLVFLTSTGRSWRSPKGDTRTLVHRFRQALNQADAYRQGVGFYGLRHMTETVGGDVPLQSAQVTVDYIMGHAPHANNMGSIYREWIADPRLRAVSEHIRGWLFDADKSAKSAESV